MLLTTTQV